MSFKFDFTGIEIITFKGRPTPIKTSHYGGNKEFTKLSRPLPFQSYPRKLIKDKEKFYYLKHLLVHHAIQPDIFVDLASVLPSIRAKWIVEAIENGRN